MIDRVSLLAASALLVSSLVARECGEPPLASAPGIATDGTTFTLAWDGNDNRSIFAQQFDGRGKPLGDRVTVFRDDGVRGRAAIVRTSTGYLVLGTHHNRDAEKDFTNQLFAVPLDPHGKVLDTPRMQWFGDDLCGKPIGDGDRVIVGLRWRATSHRHPYDYLSYYILDPTGGGVGFDLVTNAPFSRCALAVDAAGAVAIAFTSYNYETKESSLWLRFDVVNKGPWVKVELPTGYAGSLAMVRDGDNFAVMSGDDAGRVHVRWISRDGLRGQVTLPPEVDPDTADLATTDRGLFASWRDGGTVRIAPVANAGTTKSASAGMVPTGTTAIGAGDRCVAAWTNRDGRAAHVLVAPGCP